MSHLNFHTASMCDAFTVRVYEIRIVKLFFQIDLLLFSKHNDTVLDIIISDLPVSQGRR